MDTEKLILQITYNVARLLLQKGTVEEVKEWLKFGKSFRKRQRK